MSKVILHIGAHKTGTSFLQQMFNTHQSELLQDGIVYPELARNGAHHLMASIWSPTQAQRTNVTPDDAKAAIKSLCDEHANSDRTLLLSAENFSRLDDEPADFSELTALFDQFDEFHVVYVARSQPALINSVYSQVAFGNSKFSRSMEDFVAQSFEHETASHAVPLNHQRLIEHVAKGVDMAQIHVASYEALVKSQDGLFSVFNKLVGWDKAPAWTQEKAERVNVSMSALACALAVQICKRKNVSKSATVRLNNALIAKFGENAKTSILTAEEIKRVEATYKKPNAWINDTFGSDNPYLKPFEPVDTDALVTRDKIGPDFWEFFAARMVHALGVTEERLREVNAKSKGEKAAA